MFIKKPWLLILFVLTSLCLVIFCKFFNETKTLNINPVKMTIDKIDKGLVTKTIPYPDAAKFFICEIGDATYDSYCRINFYLSQDLIKGIDFSEYESIYFDVENINTDGKDNFSITLRNYDRSHSNEYDKESLKPNGAFINKAEKLSSDGVLLGNFSVKAEWIEMYSIPYDEINKEFDNISIIQVQTGRKLTSGFYNIKIENIQLKGRWIQQKTMMLFMIFKWMSISLFYSVTFLYRENKRADFYQNKNNRLRSTTKKLIEQYKKDPLTGVYNRHGFRKWLAYNKEKFDVSIIYMDLDHFKNVNDVHGHQMGDTILCEFADLLTSSIEKGDILCRWGGEEFVIFCKNKDIKYAESIVKKVRNKMKIKVWSHNETMTVSAGISKGDTFNISKVIEKADEALYQSKKAGRDQYQIKE